ncbi:MAG: TIGR03960 family B12-binding radical SAM protein [Microthrixaceae bacterium]
MTNLWSQLEPLLAHVSKPARYIGCEDGAATPRQDPDLVSWLLIYPDTYEIGLPNQGLQILYEILNERADASAERSYAPWVDLEAELRAHGLPLFSVDTHRAAPTFDLLAFNLSAELTYTNLLNCIDLAQVPVRSAERTVDHPFVVAGGHCTYNPEPIADFVDFVVLGDGEEVVSEITQVLYQWKNGPKSSREDVLRELSHIEGVYVPSMYEVEYDGQRLVSVTPRYSDVPEKVEKRTIADLAEWPYPKSQLVPLTEVVHDRLNVEVFRGCTRGCRFCQAGMITRPVRERPADQVRTMVAEGLKRTGYDEVALTSLSSADFSGIQDVVTDIVNDPANCGQVSVSLPSLRVDAFTVGVAAQIQKARRTGLTFAPEAGSWRMRQVINKLIREEDLYGAVESAYSQGWRRMKLYFLTGLPTETDEDTLGIAELARNVVEIGKAHHKTRQSPCRLADSYPSRSRRSSGLARTPLSNYSARSICCATRLERLEDLTSNGMTPRHRLPRELPVVGIDVSARSSNQCGERAGHSKSGRSTSTSDSGKRPWLNMALSWIGMCIGTEPRTRCFPGTTSQRVSTRSSCGRTGGTRSMELGLEDCRWTPCYDCGACTGYSIEHIVASATPPAGGSQGTGVDRASGGVVPVTLLPRKPAGVS